MRVKNSGERLLVDIVTTLLVMGFATWLFLKDLPRRESSRGTGDA